MVSTITQQNFSETLACHYNTCNLAHTKAQVKKCFLCAGATHASCVTPFKKLSVNVTATFFTTSQVNFKFFCAKKMRSKLSKEMREPFKYIFFILMHDILW